MAVLKTHLKSDADSKTVRGTYQRYESSLSKLTKVFVDCGFGPRKSTRVFHIHERMEECRRLLKAQDHEALPGESVAYFQKRKRWADSKLKEMELTKRAAWKARRALQSYLKGSTINAAGQEQDNPTYGQEKHGSFIMRHQAVYATVEDDVIKDLDRNLRVSWNPPTNVPGINRRFERYTR